MLKVLLIWSFSVIQAYDIYNKFDIRVEITPFKCWTCESRNYVDCSEDAVLITCPKMNDESENTWSCGVQERTRDGIVSWISMGCRQTKQCQREWRANFICTNCHSLQAVDDDRTYECFGNSLSHCRQCCGTSECNQSWTAGVIDTEIEWASSDEHRYINHFVN